MTYRSKIIAAVAALGIAVILASALSAWSIRTTDSHIKQVNLAHSLLSEHLQLSVHTYRLFKQLTDEIVLGSSANQSIVRNKRSAIAESIERIQALEVEQRASLGLEYTRGSIEDTSDLKHLIDLIVRDFQTALKLPPGPKRAAAVDQILEERIDVSFRDSVNTAVDRQRNVIRNMNARIDAVHSNALGALTGLVLVTLILSFVMGWFLVRSISTPLDTLGSAAEAWTKGDLNHRIAMSNDTAFNRISSNFNQMSERLDTLNQQQEASKQYLHRAVDERTRELSEANAKLQKADAIRRQFFADVSHELRTPLTVIRGEAQIALRGQERSEQDYRDALKTTLDQAVGLSRLVDDMLFIARTDAERIRLQLNTVPLSELIDSVVGDVSGLVESRNIRIESTIEPEHITLKVDEDRFRQLLIILLDNATRFSPSGDTVRVRCHLEQGNAVIAVSDRGQGIDSQELPYIFDRFFRGGSERDPMAASTVGLGLGLAVAKAIVEAHGGKISAQSVVGEGTTIKAVFPVQA